MSDKKNVLVLSAGRRVELVENFQKALKKQLPGALVYTTDMRPGLSAACQISDKWFKAPRVTSDGYIDYLKQLCLDHDIGLMVPTIDTELLLLARHRHEFAEFGVHLIVSAPELVARCRDKRKTAVLFDRLNIDRPAIYDKEQIKLPCFCKPYDGSCSIGAQAVFSESMLTPELLAEEKNIFMELVGEEFVEYTIDAYYNKSGKLCCLVPRERIEVRSGEVSKGATRKHFVYDYLRPRLSGLEGAAGCLTVQVFYDPEREVIKGLEINPRFGGGYPLTCAAGADYAEWLIAEYLLNEEVGFRDDWEADLLMLRYDAKVILHDADQ